MDKGLNAAALGCLARRILFGAAILVAAGQSALAAPTTLVCSSSNNGSLGPDVFELNEAQRSVTITFSSFRANNGDVKPGRSSGVLPATFTPNAITISNSADGTVNVVPMFFGNVDTGGQRATEALQANELDWDAYPVHGNDHVTPACRSSGPSQPDWTRNIGRRTEWTNKIGCRRQSRDMQSQLRSMH
jgi:hypothetical protein